MNINYRYTKQQVARGTRADAEQSEAWFLFKNVSALRLTYQIRLLAYHASESGRKLIIRVPAYCQLHPALRIFQTNYSKIVRVERT